MIDPKFERVLLAKIPGNLADVKNQIKWMRLATIALANTTRLPSDPDLPPAPALVQ